MLKKNKKLIIIIVGLIILIIFFLFTKALLYPNINKSVYGDRLKGANSVLIKEDLQNDIINNLKSNTGVKKASIDIRGKIINIIFEVDSTIDVIKTKEIANASLLKFSDKEQAFYDIQFFISKKDNESFPVIGYKNKVSAVIVWTVK